MKRFIIIAHATQEALNHMYNKTPQEMEEDMKPWLEWRDALGNHLIDFGAPLSNGLALYANGSTIPSQKDVSGYMIIQAENMDEAISLAKMNPHFNYGPGCHLEIHEAKDLNI